MGNYNLEKIPCWQLENVGTKLILKCTIRGDGCRFKKKRKIIRTNRIKNILFTGFLYLFKFQEEKRKQHK